MREQEGFDTNFIIQVDTLCHRIPNFVEKAARAGCKRVFIGLENINPDSLKTASKGQNRITEYRRMLQAWRNAGVITYCGYILGFPADTPESIERDIRIIQRELPLDMLEFFCLTPLPGSQDHKALYLKGAWMDPDMNKYDLEHVVSEHPRMSRQEWEGIYDRAWHVYYSWAHVETLLKRAIATGIKPARLASMIFQFYASYLYERVHPLQTGVFRRKVRTQRRLGKPAAVLSAAGAGNRLHLRARVSVCLETDAPAQAPAAGSEDQGLYGRGHCARGRRAGRAPGNVRSHRRRAYRRGQGQGAQRNHPQGAREAAPGSQRCRALKACRAASPSRQKRSLKVDIELLPKHVVHVRQRTE
jgi:hypothetical protein